MHVEIPAADAEGADAWRRVDRQAADPRHRLVRKDTEGSDFNLFQADESAAAE